MAKTLHKMAAAVLAGSMLFAAGSVFAAGSQNQDASSLKARVAAQQARHQAQLESMGGAGSRAESAGVKAAGPDRKVVADTVLDAEIIGYEQGDVYLLQDAGGKTVRADLGKNGGRLWRLTPMKFSGTFVQDESGRLFKMAKVEYEDPNDGGGKLNGAGRMAVKNLNREGDPALYHQGQVPTDNPTYITQNLAGVTDLGEYREMSVSDLNQAASGTKAMLVGRPVETVSPDKVMTFWDRGNDPFYVLMNGGFIPLGQRCYLYGTVRRGADNVTYLSLEEVESIQ